MDDGALKNKDFIDLQGQDPDRVWTKRHVEELYQNCLWRQRRQKENFKESPVYLCLCDCESVLEVGSGMNPNNFFPNQKYVAVDVSLHMVEKMKKLHPEVDIRQANAYALPFEDGSFDCVRSSGMLRHMKTWQPALKEMLRVAKRKVIFSHLISNEIKKCGLYQKCTTYLEILDALGKVNKIEDYTLKQIQGQEDVKSVLFIAWKQL